MMQPLNTPLDTILDPEKIGTLRVRFEGKYWNQDVMVFESPIFQGKFRGDVMKLCLLKRKLDMCREYGWPIADAYPAPTGTNRLVNTLGDPLGFTVVGVE